MNKICRELVYLGITTLACVSYWQGINDLMDLEASIRRESIRKAEYLEAENDRDASSSS
jgi:hypothetical protein